MPRIFPQLVVVTFALCAGAALLVFPRMTEAAIQFGNVTSLGFHCGTPVNCSNLDEVDAFAAPAISGSNAVLLIAVSLNGGSEVVPDFVTYDGVNLGSATFDSGQVSSTRTLVWVVTNPGSAKLVDMQVGPAGQNGVIMAAYYTGINQVTPYRAATTGTGTTNPGSLSVTNSQAGDLIVGFFSTNDTSAVNGLTSARAGAGQAFRNQTANPSEESQLASSDEPSTSGSVTHSWDFVNDAGNGWAGVAIPLISARQALAKPPNNLGLVGYWSFNEGTSTVATDFSGGGRHATFPGGAANPTWVSGKRGTALSFDGSDDFLQTDSSVTYGTSFASVAFWLKWDAYANDCKPAIRSGDTDTQNGAYIIVPNECDTTGVFGVYLSDGSGNREETFSRPSAGVWHHYVILFDHSSANGDITVYVDGSVITTNIDLNNKTSSGTILAQQLLMMTDSVLFSASDLDEVRIYNRALGPTEIAALYGRGTGSSGAVQIGASTQELQKGTTLATGLVGHWTFDGLDTQNVIADRSGNSNHGYFNGRATSSAKVSGKLGQALDYDGSGDYVGITSSVLAADSTDVTIAAWVRWDGTPINEHSVVTQSDGGGFNYEFFIAADGSAFEFGQSGVGGVTSLGSVLQNTWTHIVVTRVNSSDAVVLYKNGVQDNTGTLNMTDQAERNLVIGSQRAGGPNQFNGQIDDVRVYNRVLTATEVKQLYNLGQTTIQP